MQGWVARGCRAGDERPARWTAHRRSRVVAHPVACLLQSRRCTGRMPHADQAAGSASILISLQSRHGGLPRALPARWWPRQAVAALAAGGSQRCAQTAPAWPLSLPGAVQRRPSAAPRVRVRSARPRGCRPALRQAAAPRGRLTCRPFQAAGALADASIEVPAKLTAPSRPVGPNTGTCNPCRPSPRGCFTTW